MVSRNYFDSSRKNLTYILNGMEVSNNGNACKAKSTNPHVYSSFPTLIT